MKEGGGGDHVSVGVKKPRSRRIRPISKRDIFVRPPSKKICIYRNMQAEITICNPMYIQFVLLKSGFVIR